MVLNLKSATIQNYKSLGDVSLKFRDLTIIVGANSTGKSNILEALNLLSVMVYKGSPPPLEINKQFRVMKDELIYKIKIEDENKKADYELSISANSETEKASFSREKLKVDKIEVIDIVKGEGNVQDEDGEKSVDYRSRSGNLALNTSGDFGYKPFTSEVSEFIKRWEFYNLDPETIGGGNGIKIRLIKQSSSFVSEIPKLDPKGREVPDILLYWAEKKESKFQEINQKLENMVNMKFKVESDSGGEKFIQVLERDGVQVPLSSMADGTLRLIAYLILLIDDELPPLIGIEEPERSFHPGLLSDIASIIKQLSQKTQVVITTHSSQLLDCFTADEINSDVSLILLTKKDKIGTVAHPIDELSKQRESFLDWMQEFGVGSAIFHSQLLYDIQKQ